MTTLDIGAFIDLFLTGKSLQTMISHICNTAHGSVTDPITNTLCMMIKSPIQIVLTQVGVAPFKVGDVYYLTRLKFTPSPLFPPVLTLLCCTGQEYSSVPLQTDVVGPERVSQEFCDHNSNSCFWLGSFSSDRGGVCSV